MSKKIYVAGVNGSGKTTVLNIVAQSKPSATIIDSSRAFMEFLGFGDNYDKLRALENAQRDEQLGKFMKQVFEEAGDLPLLFAGHPVNLKEGVTSYISGPWMGEFDALVFISASPEETLRRIRGDENRDRSLFPDEISDEEVEKIWFEYCDKYYQECINLSKQFSLDLIEIDNPENGANEAAKQILSLLAPNKH